MFARSGLSSMSCPKLQNINKTINDMYTKKLLDLPFSAYQNKVFYYQHARVFKKASRNPPFSLTIKQHILHNLNPTFSLPPNSLKKTPVTFFFWATPRGLSICRCTNRRQRAGPGDSRGNIFVPLPLDCFFGDVLMCFGWFLVVLNGCF